MANCSKHDLARAMFKLGLLSGEEIKSFANDLLSMGVYSNALNEIFYFDKTHPQAELDLERLLCFAMVELDDTLPSLPTAAIRVINAYFIQFKRGTLASTETVSAINAVLWSPALFGSAEEVAIRRELYCIEHMYDCLEFLGNYPAASANPHLWPRFPLEEKAAWERKLAIAADTWLGRYDALDAEQRLAASALAWNKTYGEDGKSNPFSAFANH